MRFHSVDQVDDAIYDVKIHLARQERAYARHAWEAKMTQRRSKVDHEDDDDQDQEVDEYNTDDSRSNSQSTTQRHARRQRAPRGQYASSHDEDRPTLANVLDRTIKATKYEARLHLQYLESVRAYLSYQDERLDEASRRGRSLHTNLISPDDDGESTGNDTSSERQQPQQQIDVRDRSMRDFSKEMLRIHDLEKRFCECRSELVWALKSRASRDSADLFWPAVELCVLDHARVDIVVARKAAVELVRPMDLSSSHSISSSSSLSPWQSPSSQQQHQQQQQQQNEQAGDKRDHEVAFYESDTFGELEADYDYDGDEYDPRGSEGLDHNDADPLSPAFSPPGETSPLAGSTSGPTETRPTESPAKRLKEERST